jgi:hypothetical protein
MATVQVLHSQEYGVDLIISVDIAYSICGMKQGIDRNRQKDVFLFMGLNPK